MGLSLQEGREVQGFTVDLPSSLFVTAKEEEVVEHRVLLVDVNSQAMFQVMLAPCSTVGCHCLVAQGSREPAAAGGVGTNQHKASFPGLTLHSCPCCTLQHHLQLSQALSAPLPLPQPSPFSASSSACCPYQAEGTHL